MLHKHIDKGMYQYRGDCLPFLNQIIWIFALSAGTKAITCEPRKEFNCITPMGMLDGEKCTASNVLFSFLAWIQNLWIVDRRGVIFLKDISNIFSMVDADVLHRGYVEWYNKPIYTIIRSKVNSNVCDNLMKWWNKLYNMSIKQMHW